MASRKDLSCVASVASVGADGQTMSREKRPKEPGAEEAGIARPFRVHDESSEYERRKPLRPFRVRERSKEEHGESSSYEARVLEKDATNSSLRPAFDVQRQSNQHSSNLQSSNQQCQPPSMPDETAILYLRATFAMLLLRKQPFRWKSQASRHSSRSSSSMTRGATTTTTTIYAYMYRMRTTMTMTTALTIYV